jgi:hypothetical protein
VLAVVQEAATVLDWEAQEQVVDTYQHNLPWIPEM